MSMDLPMPPSAIRRQDWGAEFPRSMNFGLEIGLHIHITVTDTDPCTTQEECSKIMRQLQKEHKETLPDIKYSFVVGGDGHLYVGRGWVEDPYIPEIHKDKDHYLYSVAYVGRKGHVPSPEEKRVFDEWRAFGEENTMISTIAHVHQDK